MTAKPPFDPVLAPPNSGLTPPTLPIPPFTAWGCREAAVELHDACLRGSELAEKLLMIPELPAAIGDRLAIELRVFRSCVQSALDHARRMS
jgi:hypothetical protein